MRSGSPRPTTRTLRSPAEPVTGPSLRVNLAPNQLLLLRNQRLLLRNQLLLPNQSQPLRNSNGRARTGVVRRIPVSATSVTGLPETGNFGAILPMKAYGCSLNPNNPAEGPSD